MNTKITNVIKDVTGNVEMKGDQMVVALSENGSGEGTTIEFSPFPTPLFVEADKTRIFEVLSNLIRNAIKFTKEGKIEVRLSSISGNTIVEIIDTGKGIDQEVAPKLFTKFTTKSEKGTGLGLYISKSIVEAHGGKMWAENNKTGKGATFGFSLPLAQDPAISEYTKEKQGAK